MPAVAGVIAGGGIGGMATALTLHQIGVLTEAEFASKKAELLARL